MHLYHYFTHISDAFCGEAGELHRLLTGSSAEWTGDNYIHVNVQLDLRKCSLTLFCAESCFIDMHLKLEF